MLPIVCPQLLQTVSRWRLPLMELLWSTAQLSFKQMSVQATDSFMSLTKCLPQPIRPTTFLERHNALGFTILLLLELSKQNFS